MTIKEAIDVLSKYKRYAEGIYTDGIQDAKAFDMAIDALEQAKPRGVYECFHCGSYSVVWGADFTFEDYGLEGEGLVHSCHCQNCGADIEYYVPIIDKDIEELEVSANEN